MRLVFLLALQIVPGVQFIQAQSNKDMLIDSIKLVNQMPYICEQGVPGQLGCGENIFWNLVKRKQEVIPTLIGLLTDTTTTAASVPNIGGQYTVADIAYSAIQEIIHDLPTFELLGVQFDKEGCGYCSYWNHLRSDIKNRKYFQQRLGNWFAENQRNLVWIIGNDFATCDCNFAHPNGGHFELVK